MFRSANRLRAFDTKSRWAKFLSFYDTEVSPRHLGKGDALPPVDPSCLRIYKMRFCPFAHRTKLVLEHKKIPHETVLVNLKNKPDWLFERNPFGLVPILEHKGNVIYESAVCNEFLEEAFPGSNTGTRDLMPSCPYRRSAVRLLIQNFSQIFPSALRVAREDDPEKRLEQFNTLQSKLEELEKHLATTGQPYLTGSEYGMADLHLYPMFERLPGIAMFGFDVFPAGKFPLLTAWTARMQQLDCVRKVWISPQLHYYQLSEAKKPSVIPYDVEMDKETIAMQNSVVN